MQGEQTLLTFIVRRADKDAIVDMLMLEARLTGFTVTDSQGFSREHSEYSLEEQVAGYREVSRFEITCPPDLARDLSGQLEQRLSEGFKFWLVSTV